MNSVLARLRASKEAGQAHVETHEATPACPPEADVTHDAAQAPARTHAKKTPAPPAPKKRGRPALGDRPMTQSEMNARSRAKKKAQMTKGS